MAISSAIRWAIVVAELVMNVACFDLRGPVKMMTKQQVSIDSDPQGADVTVDGIARGETPLTLPLDRRASHVVALRKPRYLPASATIESQYGKPSGGLEQWELAPAAVYLRLTPAADPVTTTRTDNANAFLSKFYQLEEMRSEGLISNEEYGRARLALLRTYEEPVPVKTPGDPASSTQRAAQ